MVGCGDVVTTLEGLVTPEPADELDPQCQIAQDGERLNNKTTQHDPYTLVGSFAFRSCDRRKGSADTLES